MKASDLIQLLVKKGWAQVGQKGSHKHFKHEKLKGKITVPSHKGKEIPIGTLNAILKQAGLK